MNAVTNNTETVTIKYDAAKDTLSVDPEKLRCHINKVKKVRWISEGDVGDWRVVFGSYSPVFKAKEPKVASNDDDTLELMKNRAEDLGHWKYVVVAQTSKGLRHLDPELIVDDN